jgi:hypothetical protein
MSTWFWHKTAYDSYGVLLGLGFHAGKNCSPVEEESGKRRGSGDRLGVRLGRRGGAQANEANGAQASYSER